MAKRGAKNYFAPLEVLETETVEFMGSYRVSENTDGVQVPQLVPAAAVTDAVVEVVVIVYPVVVPVHGLRGIEPPMSVEKSARVLS